MKPRGREIGYGYYNLTTKRLILFPQTEIIFIFLQKESPECS